MEVNGVVLAAFSIFLLILFTVNLISNYEQAAKRFDHRPAALPHKEQVLAHSHTNINDRIYHLNEVFSNLNKTVQLDNKLINLTFPEETPDVLWPRKRFGPIAWTTLHVMAANFPVDPNAEEMAEFSIFLYLFGKYFPCKKCGAHFLKRLATKPLNVSSRLGITQYLCQLHNEVNVITNKTIFDCENNLTQTYGGKCGCEDEEASKNTTNTENEKNKTVQNGTSTLKNKEDEVKSAKSVEILSDESDEKKIVGGTEKKNKEEEGKKSSESGGKILTPFLCLFTIMLLRHFLLTNLSTHTIPISSPLPFNVPVLYNYFHLGQLAVQYSSCLTWYAYSYDSKYTRKDAISQTEEQSYIDSIFTNKMNQIVCHYKIFNKNKTDQFFTVKQVPFFKKIKKIKMGTFLQSKIEFLNADDFVSGRDMKSNYMLPDGGYIFRKASDSGLEVILRINDITLPEYHTNNGITKLALKEVNSKKYAAPILIVAEGQLSMFDFLSKAYIHKKHPKNWIISGIKYLPMKESDATFYEKLINLICSCLLPLSLSLLMPSFMSQIVAEKSEGLLELMKVNGLKMKYYWLVNATVFFITFLLAAFVFLMYGYFMTDLSIFQSSNRCFLILTIIGWGMNQIATAIFFQAFIWKPRNATVMGYLFSICTIILAFSLNMAVYPFPRKMPYVLTMYPPFGFCRIFFNMLTACSHLRCLQSWSSFDGESMNCLIYIYVFTFILLLLGIYLHEVISQEKGIKKHPLFFISELKSLFQTQVKSVSSDGLLLPHSEKSERTFPLSCKNLTMEYPNKIPNKIALDKFSLEINHGEVFGLLGPNGAGKTTLVSILTGGISPTSGEARIGGYSILNEMENIRKKIGVCPQFDVLWDELTIEEHLLFYCRIKDIPKSHENKRVSEILQDVDLLDKKYSETKTLSGGMKRRLSVAIALAGYPNLIFLDEPTTGLDPINRRNLWNIIRKLRNVSIILTTHLMEEADVVCNRVGIIREGGIIALGSQVELKSWYGGGYHLFINQNPKSKYNLETFVKLFLPSSVFISKLNGNHIFQVPISRDSISKFMEQIERNKQNWEISEWGLSQCTLEDVYLKIVENKLFIQSNR